MRRPGPPSFLAHAAVIALTLAAVAAQAHTDSGSAKTARLTQALNYPVLKGYALVGDWEGVLTLALGLQATTSIRVGELPGRLYIDLRA